jgi:two-component system, NtrC family, nitrogen regulation sensor histidine kinase GlnL
VNAPDPDQIATGLLACDEHGRVEWANRAAGDLIGRRPASLPGLALAELSPLLAELNQRMRDRAQPLQAVEIRLVPDGPAMDLHLQSTGSSSLIEMHPVVERIRQREMAERADRQQAISLLSRRLAHELRNPLAGVRGAAQLISAASNDPTLSRHARLIQREVDRITGLIERFAGNDNGQREPVNLHQVLDEVAELIQAEHQGDLALVRQYDPSIPELHSSSGQLHQLFLNLMRNSLQAGAGRIQLTSRIEHHSPLVDEPARHAVRIDVDDDGEGVPDTLRDRLFLPLVTGRDQGSGFGLAVVQQIARAHGGLVEYLPLNPGSRFRVRLPLIPAREGEHD